MQSNGENNILDMEPNLLCQTKPGTHTKDRPVRAKMPVTFFRHCVSSCEAEEIRRRASEIPPTPYGVHTVHYSMGVYHNETGPKTHCYAPYGRMRPYFIPHRTRTKSESSEAPAHGATSSSAIPITPNAAASSILMETCEPPVATVSDINMNASVSGSARYKNPVVLLKKSRSLEDVRVDNSLEGSQHSHEMEFVSSRIQKLKVQE